MASSADKYTAYDPNAPLEEGPGPVGYVALVLAWLVPGLGHMLIGQKGRGLLFMICIHALFAAGMLMGGIRVINPPDQPIWTYTELMTGWPMLVARNVERASRVDLGDHSPNPQVRVDSPEYKGRLQIQFEQEAPAHETIEQKQARAIQFIKEHPNFAYDPKMQDLGSVYCGIAGMLNLLVIFDVLLRITGSKREDPSKTKNKGPLLGQVLIHSAESIGGAGAPAKQSGAGESSAKPPEGHP